MLYTKLIQQNRLNKIQILLGIALSLLLTPPIWAHQEDPMHQHQNESSLAEKNLKTGQSFLKENQEKPGIHTLASGLQYKEISSGHGAAPGPTDFVTVHYRGTLIDGSVFDSSYARKSPATFAVNAVIPGWTEALQLMKPGAKWTVYIPPQLAYGKQGVGRIIGPNATLIFDIELISVKSIDHDQDLNDDLEDEG